MRGGCAQVRSPVPRHSVRDHRDTILGMRLPDLNQADVEAVVARVGGAGVYPVKDLYAAYVAYAEEKGQEPVSTVTWGRAVSACGGQAKVRQINGKRVRAWLV